MVRKRRKVENNSRNNLIRVRFPDAVYSFWEARKNGAGARIVFRCAETGPNKNRDPETRMANLTGELIKESVDPELVLTYKKYDTFRPADISMVVAWLVSHKSDLYDLVERRLVL